MLRELRDTLQGMASALGKAGGVLAEWLSKGMEGAKKFGSTAAVLFSKIIKNVSVLMKKINVFSKLFDALGGTIKRMGNMIKRVFVFSLITSGLRSVRTQMAAYLNLNEQFTTALRRLQGVLLTAFQPIYDVIVPALTTFIRILSRAIAAVTQFFASLFGTTGIFRFVGRSVQRISGQAAGWYPETGRSIQKFCELTQRPGEETV